jgi:hypothetical protein
MINNENKRIINLYSSGNFLNSTKTLFKSIDNSNYKFNERMPQIFNYSYHISENENKDEIIKKLKKKIIELEEKIKHLEDKLSDKNMKKIEFHPISNKFETLDTSKQEILYKSNVDLSRNNLSYLLKSNSNIKLKKNLNISNSTGNIFEMNRKNKNKNYNLVRSFSQIEKDRILNTQIKIHCKDRKYSPLIPKIPKKYKGESINLSSFTVNFNNNIFPGYDSNNFSRYHFEEQLNKIKIRTENLFKKCFNLC